MAYYQVGGTLQPNNPSYIERTADRELYEQLIAGNFCYVFNSRQMGKSSLQLRVKQRLESENYKCVLIDLSGIGNTGVTPQQWYYSLMQRLADELHLQPENLSHFWQEYKDLPPLMKLSYFFEKLLFKTITENIVIFIDEIDSVLSLEFPADDFFIFIRYCYNQRTSKPEYQRLTFVLLGVATPAKLIQDTERTPFNIGHAIQLTPFSLEDAKQFKEGLTSKVNNPIVSENIIKEVWKWTGGQPFLTQKLCQIIVDSRDEVPVDSKDLSVWTDKLVYDKIITNWEEKDNPQHFSKIRDRIRNHEESIVRILKLYLEILNNNNVNTDESIEQTELRLSGLVLAQDGKLKVYNRLYQKIFNSEWVAEMLADKRPYEEELLGWKSSKQDKDKLAWLLHGEKLKEAMLWSVDKILTIEDYQFLNASQESEIVKQESEIADKKSEIKKHKRFQLIFAGIATIASVATFAIGFQLKEKIQCIYTPYICEPTLFSEGQRSFLLGNGNYDLKLGVKEFTKGLESKQDSEKKDAYQKAVDFFRKAKDTDKADPEAEIYYNNALAQQSGNYVTLAVAVPINDISARKDLARETLRGVALAQSEFNEKNKKFRKPLLNIVIADDYGDEEYAKKVAQNLIKDNRVLGVIGHGPSSVSYAAVGDYDAAGLAMVSPISTSTLLSWKEFKYKNNVFYRTVPSDKEIGERLAKYTIKQNLKRIVVYYKKDDVSSESITGQFKKFFEDKQAGRSVILTRDIASSGLQTSYEAFQVFQNKADGVVFLPSLDLVSRIVEISHELKENKENLDRNLQLLAASSLYSTEIIRQGKDDIEGLVMTIPWFSGEPNAKDFANKACTIPEVRVSSRTAGSYDATKAFLQVISQLISQSKNPTRQGVLDNLKSVNLPATETSGYPLQFQNGERSQQSAVLAKVVRNNNQFKQKIESDRKYPCKSFEESGFHLELVE
ncbi:AAA-like domain-containing protein [Pelatocladus sp. BLCC-F211]|uniref:AAA-like domain-containing protein n=1 Tax=Pelatocladus sp. BLCC-F211 TaxID=3342752 RepID=UPI0035B98229